ncbi:MAG: hypothetical protein EPO32_09895 [Anaerolineae bacterium]|nr:MAG: hypothetical protein EPO32_09895 [Anaerolineae bacterium]
MAKVEYRIVGDEGYKRIEMQNLIFPNRCPCCGTPNPISSHREGIGITVGYQSSISRQTIKYLWKEWDIPYCSFCLEHDVENNERNNAMVATFWGSIVWAFVVFCGWASLRASSFAGTVAFIVGLAIIYALWGRRAIKRTNRKPSCFVPTMTSSPTCLLINYGKFSSGSPLDFTFHDKDYEKEFIEVNGLASNYPVNEAKVVQK